MGRISEAPSVSNREQVQGARNPRPPGGQEPSAVPAPAPGRRQSPALPALRFLRGGRHLPSRGASDERTTFFAGKARSGSQTAPRGAGRSQAAGGAARSRGGVETTLCGSTALCGSSSCGPHPGGRARERPGARRGVGPTGRARSPGPGGLLRPSFSVQAGGKAHAASLPHSPIAAGARPRTRVTAR